MKIKHTITSLSLALLLAASLPLQAAEPAPAKPAIVQKVFASPEDAARALADAVRKEDVKALLSVVGPTARSWLSSGDAVADREDWKRFLAAFEVQHSISRGGDERALLLVGEGDWVFPAPIVHKGPGWGFDAEAGREEIINRRVGRNELDTIQTLLAVVDAQREYAAEDADGNGFNDYARRFISTPGKRDGLYWPVSEGVPPSPLGPMIGAAAREGYGGKKADGAAYHGYRYRLLTAQGSNAPGGAYSYLVNDRLIGGFAIVAYPAKYGLSGVMSFVVSHEGVVYEKDLGMTTASEAGKMTRFNPDASWRKSLQ